MNNNQKDLLDKLLKYSNLEIVIGIENNKIVKKQIDIKRSLEENKIKYKKVSNG
jgi:hypothetical protein